MRYLNLLMFFLILSPFANGLAAENAEGLNNAKGSYQGSQVRRWTVVVSDQEETIKLYRDILGFELGGVRPDKKTSNVYEVFNIDRRIDTTHMSFHAGKNKRVISAVVVPDTELPKPPNSPYLSAILLNVSGRFDQVVDGLEEAGYEVPEPHALGTSGMEAGFADKDGHLHVIYAFPYTGSNYKEVIRAD